MNQAWFDVRGPGFDVVMVDSSALAFRKNLEENRNLVEKVRLNGVRAQRRARGTQASHSTGPGEVPAGRRTPLAPGITRAPSAAGKAVIRVSFRAGSTSPTPGQAGNSSARPASTLHQHPWETSMSSPEGGKGRSRLGLPDLGKDGVVACIHGGTRFTPGQVKEAIRRGVAKFSVDIGLKKLFAGGGGAHQLAMLTPCREAFSPHFAP